MPTKTATRPASAARGIPLNLPATLASLQTVMETPFGAIGIGNIHRTPGRKTKNAQGLELNSAEAARHMHHDMRMMFVGRLFMLGSLQLLAGLLPILGNVSPTAQGTGQRQRAPYGSKTGKAKGKGRIGRKGAAKTEA